jgi:hypothetical protein
MCKDNYIDDIDTPIWQNENTDAYTRAQLTQQTHNISYIKENRV